MNPRLEAHRGGLAWVVASCFLGLFFVSCWLGREYDECARDEDCPNGEICWRNELGREPIRVCISAEDVLDAGADGAAGDAGPDGAAGDSGTGDGREDHAETGPDTPNSGDPEDDAESIPFAPTGVSASDGTSPSHVLITWNTSAGAASYTVLRDDVEIVSGVELPSFEDSGAVAATPGNTGLALVASDGTRSDAVDLTWSEPTVPRGATHDYRVVAVNRLGSSPPSASDPGYRSGPPVTRYEIRIADGDWLDVGLTTSYSDTSAPEGLVDPGQAVASDATSPFHVALSLESVEAPPAGPICYRVRAVNSVGAGAASPCETGFRAAPSYTLQWQRSADSTDADYADIPGATTTPFEDTTGPIGAFRRYYRASLVTGDGVEYTSVSDVGHRRVLQLAGSETNGGDGFGSYIAMDEDLLIVGAMFEDPSTDAQTDVIGATYIFREEGDSWIEEARLQPSDALPDPRGFGMAVGISASPSVALVATTEDTDPGRLYGFEFSPELGWVESVQLEALPAYDLGWGASLGFDGRTAAVGAAHQVSTTADGSVTVFERVAAGVWSEPTVVAASDGSDGDDFGLSVAISGEWLVVGAPDHVHANGNEGATYVFRDLDPGGWTEQQELTLGEAEPHVDFGFAVALEPPWLVVTSDEPPTTHLYRLKTESWVPHAMLVIEGEEISNFGWSCALHQNRVAIPGLDSSVGSFAGTVFVFDLATDSLSLAGSTYHVDDPDLSFWAGSARVFWPGGTVALTDRWLGISAGLNGQLGTLAGAVFMVGLNP